MFKIKDTKKLNNSYVDNRFCLFEIINDYFDLMIFCASFCLSDKLNLYSKQIVLVALS